MPRMTQLGRSRTPDPGHGSATVTGVSAPQRLLLNLNLVTTLCVPENGTEVPTSHRRKPRHGRNAVALPTPAPTLLPRGTAGARTCAYPRARDAGGGDALPRLT